MRRCVADAPSQPAPFRSGSRDSAGPRSRTAFRRMCASPERRRIERFRNANQGTSPTGGAEDRRARPNASLPPCQTLRAAGTEIATTGPKSKLSRILPSWIVDARMVVAVGIDKACAILIGWARRSNIPGWGSTCTRGSPIKTTSSVARARISEMLPEEKSFGYVNVHGPLVRKTSMPCFPALYNTILESRTANRLTEELKSACIWADLAKGMSNIEAGCSDAFIRVILASVWASGCSRKRHDTDTRSICARRNGSGPARGTGCLMLVHGLKTWIDERDLRRNEP